MQTQMTLDLGIDQRGDVRDLIVRGDIEREAVPKARKPQPTPEWERVLSDGADCAFRRRCGELAFSHSGRTLILPTMAQSYVWFGG